VILFGQMLVNIPAPWSMWVWSVCTRRKWHAPVVCEAAGNARRSPPTPGTPSWNCSRPISAVSQHIREIPEDVAASREKPIKTHQWLKWH
jgi:hypothetical protein